MKKLILLICLINSAVIVGYSQSVSITPDAGAGNTLLRREGIGLSHQSTNGLVKVGTYTSGSGFAYLQTHSNHNLNFATNNGTPQMTLTTGGFVGIGTQTPSTRFEISQPGANTDLRISSDCGFCSTRLSFISDKASTAWRPGYIASGDNGGYTGSLNFYTNGTGGANIFGDVLGMTLTNKRLSIGGIFTNTSPYVLEIHPSSSAFGTALYNASGDTYWEHYVPNGLNGYMALYTNSSFKGSFSNVTGVYTSASDRTLKNNITSMGSVLDKVLQLQPSTYRFNDNNPTNKTSIGFIAQDVEALFPEFVYKNISKDGSEIRSMDYAGMSVIALKAIQEQQVMIKALQAEIQDLKNK